MAVKTYKILDCRESITGIGVVWPVESFESHGPCGCGAVELASRYLVAFFTDHNDAVEYVARKNNQAGGI
jgi:hypothetical protein